MSACKVARGADGGVQEGNAEVAAALDGVRQTLGLPRLESFRVVHCAHAFGCVLRSNDGWSLALSGDTRPCDAVVTAARDATVLVHEVHGTVALLLGSFCCERMVRKNGAPCSQGLVSGGGSVCMHVTEHAST